MTVTLRYELTGHGWADCTLSSDGHSTTVTASYLSDALGDLCAAVRSILSGSTHETASFAEEPGEYRWILDSVSEGRLRLRVIEFTRLWSNAPDAEGKLLVDVECRVRTFAGALLAELQRLYSELGEAGYQERWIRHPFPTEAMHRISSLLRSGAESAAS